MASISGSYDCLVSVRAWKVLWRLKRIYNVFPLSHVPIVQWQNLSLKWRNLCSVDPMGNSLKAKQSEFLILMPSIDFKYSRLAHSVKHTLHNYSVWLLKVLHAIRVVLTKLPAAAPPPVCLRWCPKSIRRCLVLGFKAPYLPQFG